MNAPSVDNFTLGTDIKHLSAREICGPSPVADVLSAGITSKKFEFLWISLVLHALYPQVHTHSYVTQFSVLKASEIKTCCYKF